MLLCTLSSFLSMRPLQRVQQRRRQLSNPRTGSSATDATMLELQSLSDKFLRDGYGPLCTQGGGDPTRRPSPTAGLTRWHVTTQELLIQHLRTVWPDDRARTMLDLGAQAGHGLHRNFSDSLLWLRAFHAPGSLVVGVDAFLDFALDLQHRFDHIEPFASMTRVDKVAIHAAIGQAWSCELGAELNGSCEPSFNLDLSGSFTHQYCSRTDWKNAFARLERWNLTDHSCRITRQRAGLSASTLPLPTSPYPFNTLTEGLKDGELPAGPQRYRVPSLPLDELWQSAKRSPLRGRHIDFLKIDVDSGWHRLRSQMAPLIQARAFSVLVMEIDESDQPAWRTAEELGCLLHPRGYELFLKLPCAGHPLWSQRARYLPISGESHALLPETFSKGGLGSRAPCHLGGYGCLVQDLLALDTQRHPELRELVRLGEESCRKPLPSTAAGDAPGVAADNPTGGAAGGQGGESAQVLLTENVRFEGQLEQPRPKAPMLPRCLPDGTWSCGRTPGYGAPRPSSCLNRSKDAYVVTCQDLWA